MVGDYYNQKWKYYPASSSPWFDTFITKEEFNALKEEVVEMKELLQRAKIYDEENGEPNCEMDEKLETLRKIADLVGVDLSDILGDKNT